MIYLDTIPAELKARHQWIVWRYEERDGKRTKVPYNPRNGKRAASDDPHTWSALEEALETLNTKHRGNFDGIGYVFSANDPYCGIDLDGALDEEGYLAEWADVIVVQLNSYTEITPSGRGLHILIKGELPVGGRRKGTLEMYDSGRYFTMTGEHFASAPLTIEARQQELEALHASIFKKQEVERQAASAPQTPIDLDDAALIEKARNAANGRAFEALWRGDASDYDSGSEADLALCNMLAFWTQGDWRRVDTLFRQSGLYRAKWDVKHNGEGHTYGQMTIDKALAGTRNYYDPTRSGNGNGNGNHQAEPLPESRHNPDAPAPDAFALPPLWDEATDIYRHLRGDTGRWLREYVTFASQAAPMTPESFHEAAGLFAGGVAISRRLMYKVAATAIHPNLFMLFVAPSTLYSKTTGFRLLGDLFYKAGMDHFLLPERMTPESMVQELSLGVPSHLGSADQESRLAWLKERAFAAKRGWALDEAHRLFDSFKRDFNNGLMAMMLNLYECPEKTTEQTVGRGRVTVRRAYLNFFGATTPSGVAEHVSNSSMWANGLWPRFIFVTPTEAPVFQFFPDEMPMPPSLISGLQRIANLFPTPEAELVEVEDMDGTRRKVVQILGEEDPSEVILAPGVREAWETYARVTRYEMLMAGEVEPELHGAYGRIGITAMKVAMILATMDAQALPVTVTLAHYAQAQMIAEGWRESLHSLRGGGIATQEKTEGEKILACITQAGHEGSSIRNVYHSLNMKAKTTREHIEELQAAGQVEVFRVKGTNGREVEMVRRCLSGT